MIEGIQTIEIQPSQALYRIFDRRHHPLHFGEYTDPSNKGRFDCPTQERIYGVCYFAHSPLGSFVEKFGRQGKERIDIREFYLVKVHVKKPIITINLPHTSHLGILRIESSIYAGTDYTESQLLSLYAYLHQFGGITYILRHSLEQQIPGVAIFGSLESSAEFLTIEDPIPIPADLITEARGLYRTDLITEEGPSSFSDIVGDLIGQIVS